MNSLERPTDDETAQVDEPAGAPTAAALYLIALGRLRAGHDRDAELSCRQALALDSDHADTLHLMGLLSLRAEQYDHAVDWISRAIRREPKPVYLTSLGTCLSKQGRPDEALQVFDKAVQLKPGDANLWRDLGNALGELGRTDEAILSFRHNTGKQPINAEFFSIGWAASKSRSPV